MGDGRDFRGTIGRFRSESVAAWPEDPRPPDGAPNVVIVVLDDVGFAQIGCFGSDIDTPVLDGLAAGGLRYTNFHTTALCSPTRACVLTGRNHHANGMGRVIDLATGFPGYDSRIPFSNGLLPELLVPHGYAAYAVGKWHLTPDEETNLGATRVRWPLGRGFERWYGFMDGETNQFAPTLFEDNHEVFQPAPYEDGYHLTDDLVDHAVTYLSDLRNVSDRTPFLLYLATGACHSPHQAPRPWIDRYRGRFDRGWDEWRERTHARQVAEGILPEGTALSPLPDHVPAWDSLGPDQQRLYARFMECFAAYLSHTDHQLGRLLAHLEELGERDNTIVMVLSDNGASSEGGPTGSINDLRLTNIVGTTLDEAVGRLDDLGGPHLHNNYPWGWTVAGNTPFKRWKRETHEGGVCDPLIVNWPARVTDGGAVRRQYVHAVDLVPTLLDVIGLPEPSELRGVPQAPIHGVSFAASLTDPAAPSTRTTQYFEMFGCRALYHDGWKAVANHVIFDPGPSFDDDVWELYHVDVDPSECHDLADREPERLRMMIDLWWQEAERFQVLPLDNSPFDLIFGDDADRHRRRTRYVYRPGSGPVGESVAVNVRNRSHLITADVEIPDGGAEGVLLAQGSGMGGYSLFVADGRLHYVHNFVAQRLDRVSSTVPVTAGARTLGVRFDRTGEHAGVATLLVDGAEAGRLEIPSFTPTRWSTTGEGLCCGLQFGLAVTPEYRTPFRFTGTLRRVTVTVDGPEFIDPQAERDLSLRSQ
jgi:arylsulfatase A-like enzyme